MNRKRELYLIAEAYESVKDSQGTNDEWANMGEWVKFLSQPSIANKPVSYKVALADESPGGASYGGGVTFSGIINSAKNLLQGNPSEKQKTLTNTANQLQDYFAGLNGAGVIDNATREDLMDMVANLGNTEKFINSFGQMPQAPQPQIAKMLPGQGPAITQRQKEAEQFRAVGDNELGPENALGSSRGDEEFKQREKIEIRTEILKALDDPNKRAALYNAILQMTSLRDNGAFNKITEKDPKLANAINKLSSIPLDGFKTRVLLPQEKVQIADIIADQMIAFPEPIKREKRIN